MNVHTSHALLLHARLAARPPPAVREGVFVQMARGLGQYIDFTTAAVDRAGHLLRLVRSGETPHKDLTVSRCRVAVAVTTGVKRIDAMLESTGGYRLGNAMTDIQHSIVLAPHWHARGADGGRLDPGFLRGNQLRGVTTSRWLGAKDRSALATIERRAAALALTTRDATGLDEQLHLVRVIHPVGKASLSLHAADFVSHGWLLVGDRGEIHVQIDIDETATGRKLMQRARQDLSFEREDVELLLMIKDALEVVVATAVEQRCGELMGHVADEYVGELSGAEGAPRG